MSTLSPSSIGTTYGIVPVTAQLRGAALEPVSAVGVATGELPPTVNQALVPSGIPSATTPMDEITQDAALVDGAIAMPARPLAEIIWQLRAAVNAARTSVRTSRGQATTADGTPVRTPTKGAIKVAARAYANVQAMGTHRTPARSVDVYNGKK